MTYAKNDQDWQRGRNWLGGTVRLADESSNQMFIRAPDIRIARTVRSYPQTGQAQAYSNVLATDLVFFGEDSGAFAALDAHSGEPLWRVRVTKPGGVADDLPGRGQAVASASHRGSGSNVCAASISGYGVYCTSQIRSRSRHPSSKLRVKSIICN